MTAQELQQYLAQVLRALPLDRYVERRFTVLEETATIPADMEFQFRGILRDREPKLADVLKHSRVLILAEPGGGKSVVARAAVHELARTKERIPIFAELKGYRNELSALITKAAPAAVFDPDLTVDGKPMSRLYILDGVDEIPRGTLSPLGADLQALFEKDPNASVLLTARQAFYSAHRGSLPSIASLFHVLDFSDKDIAQYVSKSDVDVDEFLAAVRAADASEEIRNPFILSVMIERFRNVGALSETRSANLSYMAQHLILSRPGINQHQQHRALRMIGVALETYSRNELTEEETVAVLRQAMRISDDEARAMLDELSASILKRTVNGLAFQMRSYGEYLAAEELEDAPIERVEELAFLDRNTPNDSWLNAVSYLVELNPPVRAYFVRRYPLWTISASPAPFSADERTRIVASALEDCVRQKQYVLHHPLINVRRLSRFVTPKTEQDLLASLNDPNDIVRGNTIALLGMREHPDVIPVALDVVKNRGMGSNIRYCAIVALANGGKPAHVPELLATLDRADPLHMNLLDMIGAIIDETQIPTVLPLMLRENAMLSAAYYHFREFKSRKALFNTLQYFIDHPNDLNTIRAEGYVEPILELLLTFFDPELAEVCADIVETIERLRIFPNHSGPMPKLFALMREADREGSIARIFLARTLKRPVEQRQRLFYVGRLVVSLITRETAQWLIDERAFGLISELAPYCHGDLREMLRPHTGGLLDAQDATARAYREEEQEREEARIRHIKALEERLFQQTSLQDTLEALWELKEDYWPDLPEAYRDWLASEISKQLTALDLEKNIRWEGETLWAPNVLSFLLRVTNRYDLKIDPDEPLALAITAWEAGAVTKYHGRHPLSEGSLTKVRHLLRAPGSLRALEEIVRFVEASGIWCPGITENLQAIASDRTDRGYLQVTALNLLAKHSTDCSFIETIAKAGANEDLRECAFRILVETQHRPTIERALAILTDDELRKGDVQIPDMSPLNWITKIQSDFAWDKLVTLRERALRLELPMLVGLITETLAGIDRKKAASVIRAQVDLAPLSWRAVQVKQAIEQERRAKIEAAQRTPFDEVLRKLKGSTSMNQLKVLCEGTTDRPVFRALIDQVGPPSNIILDSVGGWANVRAEPDPNKWLLGCKEAVMVLDGDVGRHLKKRGKPYTKVAKEERRKLANFPIELRILERYGIENYFPQDVFEKVVGTDLSAYFPIPDHVPAVEHFSRDGTNWKYRLRKFIARSFRLAQPSPKEPLYAKSRNKDAARYLALQDLNGTDLFNIVNDISEIARRLVEE
jgi:hypothetical protein